MVYQHWQGDLKLRAKAAVGTASKTIKEVDVWLPSKTPDGQPPNSANLTQVATDAGVNLELFPKMLHVGGGLTRIDFSIVFTGTIEYWQG
jgi:hypothetical protein